MGSAVDKTNLTRELERYHDAGLGGVHIIPIYGAKGFEAQYIDYLSPKWMEMLAYTVTEARRLGMGVDMTMGSGWCFGGPHVTDQEANASVVVRTFDLMAGGKLAEKFDGKAIQALLAFSPEGKCVELTDKLGADGSLEWSPASGTWEVYAVSQRPSGQQVKRAAPGGQGHMLNLIYPAAMRHYLQWFADAFANYRGPKPRALYQDSYEYKSDWAPDFFAAFEKRRGYRLQTELPALFSDRLRNAQHAPLITDPDHIARVKSDYRETISDVMAEESLPLWAKWSRRHGFLTRNQAHGSPGNWLDLYAAADIPETEMFSKDRNRLLSKFASSAAHVTGKNLAAAEAGTWLKEHFTETLGDMKFLLDDMFLSGINHVFYHGTCYSPDEAGWPGWHFYASYEMNPRNSVWRDAPALNAYAARCQAVLQSGHPDNDILLYWPIYDAWRNPKGMVQPFTIHARDWFEDQPIGKTAERLWNRGYAFDYVSDRQLAHAKTAAGRIQLGGADYRVLVLPRTDHIPVATLQKLVELAKAGATVVFETSLPADVPGWGKLEERRGELRALLKAIPLSAPPMRSFQEAAVGKGRVLVGDVAAALAAASVPREPMFDRTGLMCVRRAVAGGQFYFVANRSEQLVVNDWVPLGGRAQSVVIMDPLSGQAGVGAVRQREEGRTEVFLALQPGQSVILWALAETQAAGSNWTWWEACGSPVELTGSWQVQFLQGGPELPAPLQTGRLASWTDLGDTNAQRFAGTARYSLSFDAPQEWAEHWRLDLGRVCQSARVRLNDQDLGTLITPPFRAVTGPLKPKGNVLEVEVTNLSANRIRDLDRRGVKWKNFHDINIVGLDYKPFDASNWPLADSGLLGPVTLTPVSPREGGRPREPKYLSEEGKVRAREDARPPTGARPPSEAGIAAPEDGRAPDEWVDADTGHRVVRLSRIPGSSESLYFHQNAFTAQGDKMVFMNSTADASNRLMVMDWATRNIKPLTDPGVFGAVVSRTSRHVYYQRWRTLYATDLDTGTTRPIGPLPPRGSAPTVNAGDTLLAGTFTEPGGPRIDRSGPRSQWFDSVFEARRPQWLYTVEVANGRTNAFYRYEGWLNHVQFSPVDASLLMFCHEGPWHKLDRIWLIRTDGSGLRLMHRRTIPAEIAGHEFWSPDGQTIWFDLQVPRGEKFFLAGVDVVTGKEVRYPVERDQWSVHYNISRDARLFAGDGGAPNMVAHASDGKWIWLFTPQPDGKLHAERLVNMGKHDYALEPNVNFTPDGKWIVFRGNFDGSAQVYAVEVAKGPHLKEQP